MCGIVGVIGRNDVAPVIMAALRRLEYRGYDSAGIATIVDAGIERRRASGKLEKLSELAHARPLPGRTGIGHTRWATHGMPTVNNAHPHVADAVAVVHNGIIENFAELRADLAAAGRQCSTDTDTEVVAHLVAMALQGGVTPLEATRTALDRLRGSFAIVLMFGDHDGLLIAARRGSPLVVGEQDGETFAGSDPIALATLTRQVRYLADGDVAMLHAGEIQIFDGQGCAVDRPGHAVDVDVAAIGKDGFHHFMAKEIHEQPHAVAATLASFMANGRLAVPELPFDPSRADTRLTLIGCGTAYYACMVARYWFEAIAGIPTTVDIASEFRYREIRLAASDTGIFVSQSGETADTLAALRHLKDQSSPALAIVNVAQSSLAREADGVLPTHCGREIGVASTKAFTAQLTVLAALAVAMGRLRQLLTPSQEQQLTHALEQLPATLAAFLKHEAAIKEIADDVALTAPILYLGRGAMYPIALEGALKLKEISYLSAEGHAAGELKHGPIALIDERVPVIALAPSGPLFEKMASNLEEVAARRGRIVLLADSDGITRLGKLAWRTIELPRVNPFVAPILYSLPLQLLAYHVAIARGTDVDQPRNLAKSVTVE